MPLVKKITDGELQKYMSAKYLVDVEKGTKMLIDDIYTGREKNDTEQTLFIKKIRIALHQAMYVKTYALQDEQNNFLTEVKLPDSAVIDIIKQAKDEVSKKEADLEEREKERERQIEAFKQKQKNK